MVSKVFYIIWLSILLIMRVPDEDYSKKRVVRTKFDIYVLIMLGNKHNCSIFVIVYSFF